MSTIVLPGDVISPASPTTRLGPGLRALPTTQTIHAIRAGHHHGATPHAQFIDSSWHRYIPCEQDSVIGQVTARYAEGYRVDLGSSVPATLDHLAFHQVNRKNKPNLQPGALVYARVHHAISSMEPEIVCLAPDNKKSGGYGPLQGGFLLKSLSSGLCRRLLDKDDVTLQLIGEKVEYEVVVGMNGRIWVSAEQKKVVALICQVLKQVEFLVEAEVRQLIVDKFRDV